MGPAGVRLVVVQRVTVVANFAAHNPTKFREKTLAVVMSMDLSLPQNEGDFLTAQPGTENLEMDSVATKFFLQTCQELLVPLVAVSSHLRKACRMPREFYDALQDAGPFGASIREMVHSSINDLWRSAKVTSASSRSAAPAEARCTTEWFAEEFCGGVKPEDTAKGGCTDIWEHVESFSSDMTLLLMAANPYICANQFYGGFCTVRTTKHSVVGLSEERPGIESPQKFLKLVARLTYKGVIMDSSFFTTSDTVSIPKIGAFMLNDTLPPWLDPELVHLEAIDKALVGGGYRNNALGERYQELLAETSAEVENTPLSVRRSKRASTFAGRGKRAGPVRTPTRPGTEGSSTLQAV